MSESYSRSRQQAELAFSKTQSPIAVREPAFAEIEALKTAREEKTLRLREARLANEAKDRLKPTGSPGVKQARKLLPDQQRSLPGRET